MKLIVSCLISIIMLFNLGLATQYEIPNANQLFSNMDTSLIQSVDTAMGDGLNSLLYLLYVIGIVIAIIVALVLAIKLLFTTPAKKAEVKAAVAPFLIGLLLLFAGVPIAMSIISIFTTIF